MRLYKRPVASTSGSTYIIPGVYESLYQNGLSNQVCQLKQFRGILPQKCSHCTVGIIDGEWCGVCEGEGYLYREKRFHTRFILALNEHYESKFFQRSRTLLPFRFKCEECDGIGCSECRSGYALSEWMDYQLPAFNACGTIIIDALQMAAINSDIAWTNGDNSNKTWAWVRATERKVEFERSFIMESGEEKTYSPKYYSDLKLYSNKVEWLKAQDNLEDIMERLRSFLHADI